MKRILLLLLCLSQVATAGEAEDAALKAFVEEFGKTFIVEVLKRNADRYVTQKVGESVLTEYFSSNAGKEGAGYVSNALAIYGMYKGIEAYDDAERQSDRYYAGVQIVGAGASFINPAVGALISLAGVGQQMLGAVYEKSEMDEILAAEKRVRELNAQVLAELNSLGKADSNHAKQVLLIYEDSLRRWKAAEKYQAANCTEMSTASGEQTLACVFAAVRSLQELSLAYACLLRVVRMRLGPIEVNLKASNAESEVPPLVAKLRGYAARIRDKESVVQADLDAAGAAYARAHIARLLASVHLPKERVCYLEIQRSLSAGNAAELEVLKSGSDVTKLDASLARRQSVFESLRPLMAECNPAQFKHSGTRTALRMQRKIIEQMAAKNWQPYRREVM
jgi:hypothetical protein